MDLSTGEFVAIMATTFGATTMVAGAFVVQLFKAHQRLQDKWERFIKEASALEAQRGKRVEALFGVVDSVKNTVHELPGVINRKMDDLHRAVRSEMKDDLRDELRKSGPGG